MDVEEQKSAVASDSEETSTNKFVPTSSSEDISISKDGGLYKEILTEGHGDDHPLTSDTVFVHYVGTLLDGTKFDSSRDRGEKFQFEIGKGSVIKGWDIGVATMKRGEVARLVCAPDYAYGASGSPPAIPPNATLCFEVELFDWEGTDISPDKDGSILKSSLIKGKYSKPNTGSNVDVHIIGRHEGRVFQDCDVTFTQGEGAEQGIIEGIDHSVLHLDKDETARLKISPKYAYGSVGNPSFNIPGAATLTYDVTLKDFEKVKEAWEMDAGEKLEDSEVLKQKGTEKFKNGKYASARNNYKKIIDYLSSEDNFQGEEKKKQHSLLLSAYLNTALCELKLGNDLDAIEACNKVIEMDENNEKAFFRRGTAKLNQQCLDEAVQDFEMVLKISPDNKAAKNQITVANSKIRQQIQKEKKLFSNMFEKFAKIDAQKENEKGNESQSEVKQAKITENSDDLEQQNINKGKGDAEIQ